MNISRVSSQNLSAINQNFKGKKDSLPAKEEESIPYESVDAPFSKEASNAIKAQIQIKPFKEYIPLDSSAEEVGKILKNKNSVDRPFFNYAPGIQRLVKKSDDKPRTIENLNILLNANDGSLSASKVNFILSGTEQVNKGLKSSEAFSEKSGYNSGLLSQENIDRAIAYKEENDKHREAFTYATLAYPMYPYMLYGMYPYYSSF